MATQIADRHSGEVGDRRINATPSAGLHAQFADAREAQARWSRLILKERLRIVRGVRHQIDERSQPLIESVAYPARKGPAETLAAELIPLADACRFLESEAARILAPRRLSSRGRPLWLRRVSVELHRDPFGIVLIIGASNYPLFLPGVQALQALVAGNAVCIKPAPGAAATARALVDTFVAAGLDPALVQLLPEASDAVESAVALGADKVILTGSADTGRRVQSLLARTLTPATMELSGCDAVFVMPTADLARVARSLAFGLRFNRSATCIAPRRVFVPHTLKSELEARLREELAREPPEPSPPCPDRVLQLVAQAIDSGARTVTGGIACENATLAGPTILSDATPAMDLLRSDVLAPVMSLVPVATLEEALRANRMCPYALGATVFGAQAEASRLAKRIDAGCVVINDLIAPTADPRVPFGGRRQSGFGLTRGTAGLEEMTQLKAILHQRGNWLPHLDQVTPYDAELLSGLLGMTHGRRWRRRLQSAWSVARTAVRQRKWKRHDAKDWRHDDVG